jgi:sodium borate transporter 11
MKEKGTKNFLETGRTFATIFADIELRAKLLKAATQQEFISIIDVNSYPFFLRVFILFFL